MFIHCVSIHGSTHLINLDHVEHITDVEYPIDNRRPKYLTKCTLVVFTGDKQYLLWMPGRHQHAIARSMRRYPPEAVIDLRRECEDALKVAQAALPPKPVKASKRAKP